MKELSGHCKRDFIQWYMEYEPKSDWKYPAYDYFLGRDVNYRISTLVDFFDEHEIFINVEPHLGGGCPVFYGKVHYRTKKENVDTWQEVLVNDEPWYETERFKMELLCLDICNNVYNEIYEEIEQYKIDNEEQELPF